ATLSIGSEYSNPKITTSRSHALIYDQGNRSFSVYNSFSKVYNEKLEAPITDAEFAEDGSFAVATREADVKTVIRLYGKDIKYRGYISQSDYVFDMALNSSQGRFATIAYDVGDGIGETIITVYDMSSSNTAKKLYEHSIEGEFPLSCSYLESGALAVVTNGSLRIFNKDFEEKDKASFYEGSVGAFNASSNGAVAVVSVSSVRTVFAFNEKGELVYNEAIGENIIRADISGKYLFLQTSSGVIRINTEDKTRQTLTSGKGSMLVYSEDTAIVCGEAKAEYLVFN
ncbi:MAG: hypothetical protein J6U68_04600, partial [Clostridia bacterium]|nr:hypothetical protein [Clostridia bacterium]